ncbi:LOW QUALITY PROTEIN: hypothetical protein PHMEG_00029842 [Phytophthora megakarya]|uniref:Reverse transcriptase n=1 Tax=Phytophthora megakarya TaxID=4795 RepID=A0A225V281_9STRA|nr:LOW QUALITY PROTEIN: hypothetical protein PHMEG_00029842 [Phytophthora megakarya]
MIYDTSADNHRTEDQDALKSVHEHAALTRSQTTSRKRVHFEDEQPVENANATPELETTTEATRKEPTTEATRLSAELQWVPNAEDIDPITVQEERRRRIAVAQDEEQRWSVMKAVLRGDTRKMTYKEAREAWKWADKFVLSSDNLLYYVSPSRRNLDEDQTELSLRLVVPTTMIQEADIKE